VGINVTPSNAKLHIKGDHISGHAVVKIQTVTAGGATTLGFFDSDGTRKGLVYTDSSNMYVETNAGPLVFNTSGQEKARITAAGDVGIGTASPGGTYGKLTVAGGIRTTDDTSSKLELGRYSSGAPNSYIKLGANSNALFITNAADSVDIFTILNSGNVGIGTTSPSQKLHVSGNARITGALYDSANSAGTSGQVLTSTGTGTAWSSSGAAITGTGTTNYVAKFTGTTVLGNSSIFDDGTYVGIGTASPQRTLDVNGNIRISASGGALDFAGTATQLWTAGGASDNLRIKVNGSDVITIQSTKNVGIGNGNPAEKLDVIGNIKASGTIEAGSNITYATDLVFSSSTITTTATTANQVVTAVSSTAYRTAKFIIQATDATGGKYQSQEILAVHNGSTVAHTEYTAINVGGAVATYDVDISGGTLRLLCTPLSANSTVFKVQMTLIKS
jgi:hypothetical protein